MLEASTNEFHGYEKKLIIIIEEASLCRNEAREREKSKRAGDYGNINATQQELLRRREVLSKQVNNNY